MLDCGLPYREIMRRTNYLRPLAVLVTHEHLDHAKAVEDFLRRGVYVFMTAGTATMIGHGNPAIAERLDTIWRHRISIVKCGETYFVRNIAVDVFPTQHDAAEPCGFIVRDDEDSILYATDTFYLRYRFNGLTKIMIEANYSSAILQERVDSGEIDARLAKRIAKSHFSIENVLDFLDANDLSLVREIWLIHLSNENSDGEIFRDMVESKTGIPTYIATGRMA